MIVAKIKIHPQSRIFQLRSMNIMKNIYYDGFKHIAVKIPWNGWKETASSWHANSKGKQK